MAEWWGCWDVRRQKQNIRLFPGWAPNDTRDSRVSRTVRNQNGISVTDKSQTAECGLGVATTSFLMLGSRAIQSFQPLSLQEQAALSVPGGPLGGRSGRPLGGEAEHSTCPSYSQTLRPPPRFPASCWRCFCVVPSL